MKVEVLGLRADFQTTCSFDGIVGDSPGMREVYALMEQAVDSDITVLIRGETGTGKELVAKSFHFSSPRKTGPFLAINCSAIPETLIESELFGHERGAFTGATRRKIGLFEYAKGGTVFLDEIGDMPLTLQSKLLRVLQEREILRIGGTTFVQVDDVRVIAATNMNLEAAVKAGAFREDLFYRLAVFPVVFRPCGNGGKTFPCWSTIFSRSTPNASAKPSAAFPAGRCTPCSSTTGPATCASWKAPLSAPSYWKRARCCKSTACRPHSRRTPLPKGANRRSCLWRKSSVEPSPTPSKPQAGTLPMRPKPWASIGSPCTAIGFP